VRVEVTRSGGFAGIVRRGVVDARDLDPDAARELEQLVAAADLAAPRGNAPPRADAFQYDVAIAGEGVVAQAATFDEPQLDEPLRALIDRVLGQRA